MVLAQARELRSVVVHCGRLFRQSEFQDSTYKERGHSASSLISDVYCVRWQVRIIKLSTGAIYI